MLTADRLLRCGEVRKNGAEGGIRVMLREGSGALAVGGGRAVPGEVRSFGEWCRGRVGTVLTG